MRTPSESGDRSIGGVLVVGPGSLFLSGISYYTSRLTRALSENGGKSSVILIRRLCPKWIYPGRDRIGAHDSSVLELEGVDHFDGIDWHWGRSIVSAVSFLWRRRPEVLLLQWWTGTVAHSYLLLAIVARLRGASVVIEYHETLDVGEARIPGVKSYVSIMMRALLRLSAGFVVHSSADIGAVHTAFPTSKRLPHTTIHHGPFDQHQVTPQPRDTDAPVRFTFFGVLRSYKGLDELVDAFALVNKEHHAHLVVAGEPWPDTADAVEKLSALDGVTLRLGHLSDEELTDVLNHTDVVVLPYRRSSASGPLHIAMSSGLVVVTTDIPALAEVVDGYSGAVLAQPHDPTSLAEAMGRSISLVGQTHVDPHSWEGNVAKYRQFFDGFSRSGAH